VLHARAQCSTRRDELAGENEVGSRYIVELAKRSVTTVFEPAEKSKAPAKNLPRQRAVA
jgi:hypothetical protein